MKIFLFILVLIGLTFVGYCFSKRFKDKLVFYKDLGSFCDNLTNQITFTKNSLSQIVISSYESYSSKLKSTLHNYFIQKKPYENVDILSEKENMFVKNFFQSLGKFDSVGEIANIANYKQEIKRSINEAHEQEIKYGTLGTKLGFIFGLLVCIVLI